MHFGKQFKEYREEYLRLKQLEAALELKIDPAALSNYERSERGFPNDLLPIVKETFAVPDDYFLAMILGTPLKSVRDFKKTQPVKTSEVRERYMDSFIDRHRQLFEESSELREFVALASHLTEKDRRIFLNANKSLLTLIHKHAKEEDTE
ncbi:helix-turn-helix transcriptional regulator [Sporosarcina sp. FSL K6-2383]|uniref:helix-turn-helix domain-containing protein n=1 Tax=Sporosarcina sp. FSL K6-2383 TaxID=2921556 RepID=UPI00315A531A